MSLKKPLLLGLVSFIFITSMHSQWELHGNELNAPEESRIGSKNDKPIYFITNDETKMTLRSTTTPRFGIGTTTPNFNLLRVY